MSARDDHKALKPIKYQRVIDVLAEAQIDTSTWGAFKGKHASTNPLVYQWSFEQPGERVALFLWWEEIRISGDRLTYSLAPRKPTGLKPVSESKWKASSDRILRHVQTAYEQELPIAAVIVDGKRFDAKTNPNASKVERRLVDPTLWAVAEFDFVTRKALLVRGVQPVHPENRSVDIELSAFEGWKRKAFIWHRHREASLRREKIKRTIETTGKLACEVPNCGFDFQTTYGSIGSGFAHVHHKLPLGKTTAGRKTLLSDLAIVCPNCHAMIHQGGQCRPLTGLIP